jgi:hypothetical protein
MISNTRPRARHADQQHREGEEDNALAGSLVLLGSPDAVSPGLNSMRSDRAGRHVRVASATGQLSASLGLGITHTLIERALAQGLSCSTSILASGDHDQVFVLPGE